MQPSLPSDFTFRIKAATRDLIERCGGLERAGRICGYSTSALHRYASSSHADIISISAMLLLERDAGQALGTEMLYALQSSSIPASEPPSFSRAHALLARASAELQAVVTEASSDGVITPREQAIIDIELQTVFQALNQFRSVNAKNNANKAVLDRKKSYPYPNGYGSQA